MSHPELRIETSESHSFGLEGNTWYDADSGEIRRGWDVLQKLSFLQSRIFTTLLEHPNQVVSYKLIAIGPYDVDPSIFDRYYFDKTMIRAIQTTVQRLRGRLETVDAGETGQTTHLAKKLQTITNVGYRWNNFSLPAPFSDEKE